MCVLLITKAKALHVNEVITQYKYCLVSGCILTVWRPPLPSCNESDLENDMDTVSVAVQGDSTLKFNPPRPAMAVPTPK